MRVDLIYGLNRKDGDILVTAYKKNSWLRNLFKIKQRRISCIIPFSSIDSLKSYETDNSDSFAIHDIENAP